MEENPIIKAARERREKTLTKLEKLLDPAKAEQRELTDDEAARFEELSGKIEKLDKQIRGLEAEDERRAKAAAAAAGAAGAPPAGGSTSVPTGTPPVGGAPVRVTQEMMTYDRHSGNSYFRDMAVVAARNLEPAYAGAAEAAWERMQQHKRELEIEARHNPDIERRLREIRAMPPALEQRVNPNTTAGTGGEFVQHLGRLAA